MSQPSLEADRRSYKDRKSRLSHTERRKTFHMEVVGGGGGQGWVQLFKIIKTFLHLPSLSHTLLFTCIKPKRQIPVMSFFFFFTCVDMKKIWKSGSGHFGRFLQSLRSNRTPAPPQTTASPVPLITTRTSPFRTVRVLQSFPLDHFLSSMCHFLLINGSVRLCQNKSCYFLN